MRIAYLGTLLKQLLAIVSKRNWGIAGILVLGLALRLWNVNFGLPYAIAPDEPTHVAIALRMFITGDPNPHWLLYPSFWLYLNALAYIPYFLVARLAGVVSVPADIPFPFMETLGVGKSLMPTQFILERGLTAFFGTASIALVYKIGLESIGSKAGAMAAALLLAVSPTNVINSKLIRPDTFAVFFVLLSFLYANRILETPALRNYILAGIGAGLAVSSKYNAGLILLPMVVAHFMRFGLSGIRRKELYVGIVVSGIAFVVTTPFALLDPQSLLYYLNFNASEYITGHAGSEGNAFMWYVQYLWQTEGLFVVLALAQVVLLILNRSKRGVVLFAFPVVYFLFVSTLEVRNDRTILLIIPFLAILAAQLATLLAQQVQRVASAPAWSSSVALATIAVVQIIAPLQGVVDYDIRLGQRDGRNTSQEWIEANLPAGSRIAIESYSPFLDPKRFVVQGVGSIADHTPEWYVQNGFEYLVFSEGMYGRFFDDPGRYQDWIDKYNSFFSRFAEVKRFDDNNYEIRIFRTNVELPEHRVGVRFGDYSDLVELVGFETPVQWTEGEPLRLRFYWRARRRANEPLDLNLQLLGRNDAVVASSHGDLFAGKYPSQNWPEGMFTTDWTIPIPVDAMAGMYRIDLSVVQALYNYRAPIFNSADEKMDKLILGPIKMSVQPPPAAELQAARPANVRFGASIALLSYSIETVTRAGNKLPLTLYWQALTKPPRDYTVFVHLLDAEGKVRAQVDTQPRGGGYPTLIWDTGEVIRDDYVLKLPADLATGSYRIELGLYEYPSLVRLPVADAKANALGDHWSLPDSIQVVR
jgi:4-amino-4-deoxy-L-arabinose transferase-like glycosyltransferase